MKAPTNEAAYAFHDKSPLKLYDCLVPKIRDHIRNVSIYCESCRSKAQKGGIMTFPLNVEQIKETIVLWNN